MRLWSLHPKYLDAKGLVALWREALLAQHVLEGKTTGYAHHPQLERFRASGRPMDAVNYYLCFVAEEAARRGYLFDEGKIHDVSDKVEITVTRGQLAYEAAHLSRKLLTRDPVRHAEFCAVIHLEVHPMFRIVEGGIESWEKAKE